MRSSGSRRISSASSCNLSRWKLLSGSNRNLNREALVSAEMVAETADLIDSFCYLHRKLQEVSQEAWREAEQEAAQQKSDNVIA